MLRFGARLRLRFLGISLQEATFARRGFRDGGVGARQRLEESGKTFLQGYLTALEEDSPEALAVRLNALGPEFRGFAFEGAAMALALLDLLTPWNRSRWLSFARGPGAAHVYMLHVGVGWALARLHRKVESPPLRLDPLLRWLAVDGYGFHEGYFHWRHYVEGQAVPNQLAGYPLRVFDQGLGRSLWFVEGADVSRIPTTVAAFPQSRRADLWSGVGLACAYAGGMDRAGLGTLRVSAGPYRSQLAQGAAFAAKARARAGNPALHTEAACQAFCGMPASAAAHITDAALEALPAEGTEPAYEIWRRRIQREFAAEKVKA